MISLVSDVWIRTQNLSIVSLLPLPLDQIPLQFKSSLIVWEIRTNVIFVSNFLVQQKLGKYENSLNIVLAVGSRKAPTLVPFVFNFFNGINHLRLPASPLGR